MRFAISFVSITGVATRRSPLQNRREILQKTTVLAALLASAGFPQFVHAAYNKLAFDAKSVQDAARAAGAKSLAESKDVILTAPDVAEDGAAVPLGISTGLPNVRQLLLLVEKNPSSLVAIFQVSDAIEANFAVRTKMGQSSDVYAVAIMNDGRALWAKKEVKVTLGACGA